MEEEMTSFEKLVMKEFYSGKTVLQLAKEFEFRGCDRQQSIEKIYSILKKCVKFS